MAIFRLQEHVPDVYARKSRDFQLLCNVFDCMNGAVKYDIDSIRDVIDTDLCNERLLNYLQTKLGFFTNKNMSTTTQRIILKAFPYLIKNKGSTKGIEQAIQVFLKTQGVKGNCSVKVINRESVVDEDSEAIRISYDYVVELGIQSKLLDISILDEILKYIIPAGYIVKYVFYEQHYLPTTIENEDTIKIIFVRDSLNSGIRLRGNSLSDKIPVNAVDTISIPDKDIIPSESVNISEKMEDVANDTSENPKNLFIK